jgi:hypothetical protein
MNQSLIALASLLKVVYETMGTDLAQSAVDVAVKKGAQGLVALGTTLVKNSRGTEPPKLTAEQVEKTNSALLVLRKAIEKALTENDLDDYHEEMEPALAGIHQSLTELAESAGDKSGFYKSIVNVLDQVRTLTAQSNADFLIPGDPLFSKEFTEKVLQAKSLCEFLDRIEHSTGLSLQSLMDIQTFIFSTEPRDVATLVNLGLCGDRALRPEVFSWRKR